MKIQVTLFITLVSILLHYPGVAQQKDSSLHPVSENLWCGISKVNARIIDTMRAFDLAALLRGHPSCGLIVPRTTGTTRLIRGLVSDSAGGPIPYATIMAGGNIGTTSDSAGRFVFPIPDTCRSITASSVGFKPNIKLIGEETELRFQLTILNTQLPAIEIACGASRRMIRCFIGCKSVFIDKTESKANAADTASPVKVFPNPTLAGTVVYVQTPGLNNPAIALHDQTSKRLQVVSNGCTTGFTSLQLPQTLAVGTYYLVITGDSDRKRYTEKIIIQ